MTASRRAAAPAAMGRVLGVAVAAFALAVPLAGCGGGASSSDLGARVVQPSGGTGGSVGIVRITIQGTQVTPAPTTVPLRIGDTMTVVVTSDHDDEVHAHGFEVEKELKAGVPTTLQLTGEAAGVYEVEVHNPALTLLQVAVS